MSVFAPSMASDWQPHRLGSHAEDLSRGTEDIGLGLGFGRIQTSTIDRPPLKSHKTFPNTLTTSFTSLKTEHGSSEEQNPAGQEDPSASSPNEQKQAGQGLQELGVTTYGGSAPASPTAQLSSASGEVEHDEHKGEDDDIIGGLDEDDEMIERLDGAPSEMTPEQRRAEKRKMKRFRLTHNQTRFLMSEFARQAHPDAAQRERLAKEIPGLSPRQVQVWFQNRRAKLKRLTTDDRERMMKSRALPEDFDMTQALHSPFTAGINPPYSQSYTPPLQSPASYASPFNGHGLVRPPLMVSGLRRESEDESNISPISMSSNFNNFYTPPGSISATESLSPTSPVAERNPFISNWHQPSSNRNINSYSRSGSISSTFNPHVPRIPLAHDRLTRTRAESLGSPLRTSMSYTGNMDFTSPGHGETVPASNNNVLQPARSYSTDAASVSQTTGFSYLPRGFTSSGLSRPRSNLPPGLDLRSSYNSSLYPFSKLAQQTESQAQNPAAQRPSTLNNSSHNLTNSQPLTPQQIQTPQSPHHSLAYSSAPLAPPQDFHLPNSQELYGPQYPNTGNNGYNVGVNSAPNTATIAGNHTREPESYYKSEPGTQRITISPHQTPQYLSPVRAPPGQLLQTPHQQTFSALPNTPQIAGLKRRREDVENEDFVEHGQPGSESGGAQRRRSFTLPTGFGTNQGN